MSNIANFDFVKVYPRFPDQVVIQWELVNAFQHGIYKFNIFRSESPTSDFKLVTPVPLTDKFRFTDQLKLNPTDSGLESLFATIYYQVVVELPDGTEVASPVVSTGRLAEKPVFLKVREIHRKYKLLLSKYIGVECFILKIKKYGPSCPLCYDEVKKESRDSRCSVCYGTGKEGGYFEPIPVLGHFDMTPQTQMITPDRSLVEIVDSPFRMISDPLISPYDIIVEAETNNRWVVGKQLQNSEHKRIPVSQMFNVRELPKSHVLYTFPIPTEENKVASKA